MYFTNSTGISIQCTHNKKLSCWLQSFIICITGDWALYVLSAKMVWAYQGSCTHRPHTLCSLSTFLLRAMVNLSHELGSRPSGMWERWSSSASASSGMWTRPPAAEGGRWAKGLGDLGSGTRVPSLGPSFSFGPLVVWRRSGGINQWTGKNKE